MKFKNAYFSFTLLLPVLASCALVDKGTHNAGKDCMWAGCHGYEAPAWTYAGTVFASVDRSAPAGGVAVIIADSGGEMILKVNSAGNFYTSKGDPTRGYTASISDGKETRMMRVEPTSGACNSCHSPDGQAEPLYTD